MIGAKPRYVNLISFSFLSDNIKFQRKNKDIQLNINVHSLLLSSNLKKVNYFVLHKGKQPSRMNEKKCNKWQCLICC